VSTAGAGFAAACSFLLQAVSALSKIKSKAMRGKVSIGVCE
jgi:hypothetical protein